MEKAQVTSGLSKCPCRHKEMWQNEEGQNEEVDGAEMEKKTKYGNWKTEKS